MLEGIGFFTMVWAVVGVAFIAVGFLLELSKDKVNAGNSLWIGVIILGITTAVHAITQ